jgi:Lectin C-type domain
MSFAVGPERFAVVVPCVAGRGSVRCAEACAAKGLTLARIESIENNDFVAQFLTASLWIGANDLQTPGQWYWPSATSDSDELFWSGGLDGSQQNLP